MEAQPQTITLEVLRVASPDVLGKTTALTVASPCRFSNAKGNLRPVNDFGSVGAIAEKSAKDFLAAIAKAGTI
jgi:hypothetical protein